MGIVNTRSRFLYGTISAAFFAITNGAQTFAISESKGDSAAPSVKAPAQKPKNGAPGAAPPAPAPKEIPKELSEAELMAQAKEAAAKAKLEAQGQDQADLYRALYNLKPVGWVGSSLNIQALANDANANAVATKDAAGSIVKGNSPPPTPDQGAAPSPLANAPAPPTSLAPATTHFEREGLIVEFGGQEYAQRIFSRGQRRIIITVYRFASADGAFGAYLTLRQGSSTTIRQGDATSQDDKSVSFWKDLYFVSIVGTSEDDDESLALVTSIAKTLAPNIKTSVSEPLMLTRLPLMERVQGSEKIVMGQLAAKRVFPAPYLSALLKEKMVEGVVADYKMQYPDRERVRLMLAQFSSPESASRAYSAYLSEVQAQHPPQATDGYVPQANVFKISGNFVLCQLKGNEVLLITGARKKGSLTTLARQIY